MDIRYTSIAMALLMAAAGFAQTAEQERKMAQKLEAYFAKYKPKKQELAQAPKMLSYKVDNNKKTLVINADGTFAAQEFSEETTADIYKRVRKAIPKPYRKYAITIITNGMAIEDLVPHRIIRKPGKINLWGDIDYDGKPWVSNASSPIEPTHGLQNRHISLWASHGRYFDSDKGKWKWQRPKLFGTTEDLFTPTIVIPYLIPMLENAGAIVFTPRERDMQKHEVIVDNDDRQQGTRYIEVNSKHEWHNTGDKGFASHNGTYTDGENPFVAGTARMAQATGSKKRYSIISYQPNFPAEGRYAVYVSYQTLENSVDDARYTVWHKGEKTEFRVNQQMGGGTWVYLGTFDFDAGSDEFNRVVLTNQSSRRGVVTADAVRFGGGMGNIERGGQTSGLPRSMEGARYYAQWAGMPYTVYSSRNGTNDYADDINVRSFMTNYLGGGSCYMPTTDGKKVPFELSLAIHSDAGYAKDGVGLIGSLAICTTRFNGGRLNAGISRLASRDLAEALLTNTTRDLQYKYGSWSKRDLLDKNYSETRVPGVPSAILETMSHQNFPDMRYGQDPNFKFTLARSIYKTILRYISEQHGRPYAVTPLTPQNFSIEVSGKGEATLRWQPVDDPQEATSHPTGYIVYTSYGHSDFDNGTYIRGKNSHTVKLDPGVLYSFRVAAVTRGGKSFPTEVLCAMYNPGAEKSILIVNGFQRLASPAVRDNAEEQGFDFDADPGVTLGSTGGWVGRQVRFDRDKMGIEDESGLGWSNDDFSGMVMAGNDMDYVRCHAEAIMANKRYNIASCSDEAVESGSVNLSHYQMVDLILGLERNDGHSLKYYKTFSTMMQSQLKDYTARGGAVLASGAYMGSDMQKPAEQQFLADILKFQYTGNSRTRGGSVYGLSTTMQIYDTLNEQHYCVASPEVLRPIWPAFAAMRYPDGHDAGVAYRGADYRSFAMGFPLECIKDAEKRQSIMQGILNFLLE